ncbi:hypothetical protein A2U01_0065330, partial [Trifolium medium]|nr:hypothetical protein [Trifolium medium]
PHARPAAPDAAFLRRTQRAARNQFPKGRIAPDAAIAAPRAGNNQHRPTSLLSTPSFTACDFPMI